MLKERSPSCGANFIYSGDFSGTVIKGSGITAKLLREKGFKIFTEEDKGMKKRILVVDDSGAMLRSVKGWLEDKYQVVLANSGTMAIKYLAIRKPDLILLDYEMPICDGKQVLEMIRRKPINPKYESVIHAVGLILLLALTAVVAVMDIIRLIGG